ncbi:MAG: MlaE family ABC transporter permease [Candidatus Spyradosoma sp.]
MKASKKQPCARPPVPVSTTGTDARGVVLEARISGTWALADGLSDESSLEAALAALAPGTRAGTLRFDCSALGRFDSSLLCYVVRCAALCSERGILLARETLPADVAKLLDLTLANRRPPDAEHGSDPAFTARVGRWGERIFRDADRAMSFFGETVVAVVRLLRGKARFRRRDVLYFIEECGVNALPIITLISFITGMILAYIGSMQLQQFGAVIYVASLIALAMTREMGVIMTSVIMCGRTGSAFAAQIGSMQASEEISALRVLGVNPVEYLVLPRLIALTLMLPLLTLYSDCVGMLGGLFVMGSMDITPEQYWRQIVVTLNMKHVFSGVLKSFFFGFLVAWAGCHRGMAAGKSSLDVGGAATSAAVLGMVLIVIGDGVFAVLFNAMGF